MELSLQRFYQTCKELYQSDANIGSYIFFVPHKDLYGRMYGRKVIPLQPLKLLLTMEKIKGKKVTINTVVLIHMKT